MTAALVDVGTNCVAKINASPSHGSPVGCRYVCALNVSEGMGDFYEYICGAAREFPDRGDLR